MILKVAARLATFMAWVLLTIHFILSILHTWEYFATLLHWLV